MNSVYKQEGSSAEAEEGTAAHWVWREMLEGRPVAVGMPTPNNLIVTDEMIEGAELLVGVVLERTGGLTSPLHIEETLAISSIHPDCFGTPDIWGATRYHIDIVDYKFGHRFTDEYFNPQLLCYLAGIVSLFIWPGDPTVSLTIVQPRCFYKGSPVRTHTFKLSEAIPHFKSLMRAATAAHQPNPMATTNEGCGYCPGRHACSALQHAAYSDAEFSTDRAPLDLSPAQASLELRMLSRALERLEARVDGLRESTLSNIRAGKPTPHYRAEQGYGRAQWTLPEDQIITMGQMFGKDLSKTSVITPTQAKKYIDEDVIKAYSFRPVTPLKLVADNPIDARKVFGKSDPGGKETTST